MAARQPPPVSIFDFVDYRDYLRSYYEHAKLSRRDFSYRFFSKLCGYSSPNFLKLIIEGKRNLGLDSVERFHRALALDQEEGSFFADLVAFNQAQTVAEKSKHFERVAASRRFRAARRIDGPLFEYLSHWYYPAIRELSARKDFDPDPAWIGKVLRPNVPVKDVERALETLLKLGLLVKGRRGELARGDASLTTGHEVQSMAVVNFHRQMLERAADAVETVPRDERDVAALTVCIRGRTVGELKERLHRFRTELLERCDADEDGDVVYQVNLQLFPLSFPKDRAP